MAKQWFWHGGCFQHRDIPSSNAVIGFFVENLSVFLGYVSVLAGALVFALQEFVACFFAWVYI